MKKRSAVATVNEWMRNAPLMLLTSAVTLTLGLAMVIGHNVWSGGALPVTVTVVGWLTLFKGLAFLLLPPVGRRGSMTNFNTSDYFSSTWA
jgi:hypothetical protein